MRKLIPILSLLFLIGCADHYYVDGKFYVKSFTEGYRVCIAVPGSPPTCLSHPINDPTDAKILAEELNRDMEGNWEK